jgi:hypothetical protein
MSELARPRLLITLVHGTWPRGLFPKIAQFKQWARRLLRRKRLGPPPFWFEEGSPFLDRLSNELADIPHKFRSIDWSGANSIFVRDNTAQILAEHLSAEHTAHPEATQLIIAHSHGGNVALRALHHLPRHDASRSGGADAANPLVATLATPFIEIHRADFGHRPDSVRGAVLLAIFYLLLLLAAWLFPSAHSHVPGSTPNELSLSASLIVGLPILIVAIYWIGKRTTARQNQVAALSCATRLTVAPQRLLVIRAIDDEASLILALGAILNYVTVKSIMVVGWIMVRLPVIVPPLWLLFFFVGQRSPGNHFPSWYRDVAALWCSAIIVTLFGVLPIWRLVHGKELAKSPMECQVNTQSTPDAIGQWKIVTLVRRTYVRSLRHGIYDHEDCPKAITDWVRSQLYAQPAR